MTPRLRAATVCLMLLVGCTKRPPPAPAAPAAPAPKQNLVVLLPDPENPSSSIVVSNPAGSRQLSQPYQTVRIENVSTSPTAPSAMPQEEVRRLFGGVLDALPQPEVHIILYFVANTPDLAPASKADLPLVRQAVARLRSTNISITGHTDTTGNNKVNYDLSLRRAESVAALLRAGGIDGAHLFVSSHGEADLLVKTADNIDEPKNRRVEVVVR